MKEMVEWISYESTIRYDGGHAQGREVSSCSCLDPGSTDPYCHTAVQDRPATDSGSGGCIRCCVANVSVGAFVFGAICSCS